MFHSVGYGLYNERNMADLVRCEIAVFMGKFPSYQISGTPISSWIEYITGQRGHQAILRYVRHIGNDNAWGGGLEMAVCSHMKNVNIHVYESASPGAYRLIARFDSPKQAQRNINLLYVGRNHYDALVVRPHTLANRAPCA